MGVVSWCTLYRDSFALKSRIGSVSFVCCPESRSARFSEVGFVLKPIPQTLSAVGRLSSFRRVRYGRFDCISPYIHVPIQVARLVAPPHSQELSVNASAVSSTDYRHIYT